MSYLFVERTEVISMSDAQNTQQVNIYFGGCETAAIWQPYHTYAVLSANFPYRVRIYVYMDTTSTCVNRSEPDLMDSLMLTAAEIISEKEYGKPNESIRVYPNPSTGLVHVKFPMGEKPSKIYLYNMQGTEVRRFETNENGRLILADLPKGIYFLRTETRAGSFVRRLVLE